MEAKKVAFVNSKGGCGKTTSLFHVAGVLSQKRERILVIDLDKQRNTTDIFLLENETYQKQIEDNMIEFTVLDYMLGKCNIEDCIKKAYFRKRSNANPIYSNIDVVISDIRLENEMLLKDINIKESLDSFIKKEKYSWVLVDMPPSNKSLNDICLSQIVDYVIVPFSSDIFSVSGFGDLMNTINNARELNHKLHIIGIYLSRFMDNCAVDKHIRSELLEFGDMFIDVQIPIRADIRESMMFGRPISYYKMISQGKTAYESLVKEMERRIKKSN